MCLRALRGSHILDHRSSTSVSHSFAAWFNVPHVWDHAFLTGKFFCECCCDQIPYSVLILEKLLLKGAVILLMRFPYKSLQTSSCSFPLGFCLCVHPQGTNTSFNFWSHVYLQQNCKSCLLFKTSIVGASLPTKGATRSHLAEVVLVTKIWSHSVGE